MNEFISRIKKEEFLIKFISDNLVSVNDKTQNFSIIKTGDDSYSVLYGNKNYNCRIISIDRNNFEIFINNTKYQIDCKTKSELLTENLIGLKSNSNKKNVVVVSPMPGLILKFLKKSGEVVKKGEPVLILEAMKMENEILSPREGQLIFYNIQEGSTIEKNSKLFEIK